MENMGPEITVCKHCGQHIPQGVKFCPECGKRLKEDGGGKGAVVLAVIAVGTAALLAVNVIGGRQFGTLSDPGVRGQGSVSSYGGGTAAAPSGPAAPAVMTEEEAMAWIGRYAGTTVSASGLESARSTPQGTFDAAWRKALSAALDPFRGDLFDIHDTEFISVLERYAALYRQVWDTAPEDTVADLRRIDEISNTGALIESIREQTDGLVSWVSDTGKFYVTGRWDNTFADQLLRELDDSDFGSDWLCYNVEYIYGTAVPGDDPYIFHSKSQNPFTGRAGVYTIPYIYTGETVTAVDSNGFQVEIPLLRAAPSDQTRDQYFENMELQRQRAADFLLLIDRDKYEALDVDETEVPFEEIMEGRFVDDRNNKFWVDDYLDEYSGDGDFGTMWYWSGQYPDYGSLRKLSTNTYGGDLIGRLYTLVFSYDQYGEVVCDYFENGVYKNQVPMTYD